MLVGSNNQSKVVGTDGRTVGLSLGCLQGSHTVCISDGTGTAGGGKVSVVGQ
jgi:hypothetical protein